MRVTFQLLDYDSKRLHFFQQLFHATEGWVSATCENLSLHIDMAARKVAPFPPDVTKRLCDIRKSHGRLPRPEAVGRRIAMPERRRPDLLNFLFRKLREQALDLRIVLPAGRHPVRRRSPSARDIRPASAPHACPPQCGQRTRSGIDCSEKNVDQSVSIPVSTDRLVTGQKMLIGFTAIPRWNRPGPGLQPLWLMEG